MAGADLLAIEKGEVHGWSGQWEGWTLSKPDWIRDGKLVHLVQLASKPLPELAGVPQLESFARDEEERTIFRTVQTGIADRALIVPPGVPADRVDAIAAAYAATLRDPAFVAEAKAAKFDIDLLPGEPIQRLIAGLAALPEATVARMKEAMGQDGLTSRFDRLKTLS